MDAIHFGGSRSLAPHFNRLVDRVVSECILSGHHIHVGCAVGADAAVIQSVSKQSFLVVFAVGECVGAGEPFGFWSGSAFSSVFAAAQAGAHVRWSAGGPVFGPQALPLKARLSRRSQAALAGCSASVFFLASASSSGSLAVAAYAAAVGQPVFAFACGFPGAPAPLRGQAGRWVPVPPSSFYFQFPGVCWQWQSAAVQPALF